VTARLVLYTDIAGEMLMNNLATRLSVPQTDVWEVENEMINVKFTQTCRKLARLVLKQISV